MPKRDTVPVSSAIVDVGSAVETRVTDASAAEEERDEQVSALADTFDAAHPFHFGSAQRWCLAMGRHLIAWQNFRLEGPRWLYAQIVPDQPLTPTPISEVDGPKANHLGHYGLGTDAPWYRPQNLTESERQRFSEISRRSAEAKRRAMRKSGPVGELNQPNLDPGALMPQLRSNGMKSLSLFSGGGGLDLGFDRAGFEHLASYEVVTDAAATLSANRPHWDVRSGEHGDVTQVDWRRFGSRVDIIHAGPPCQPFSSAGRQLGAADHRNLFPEFIRAVKDLAPLAFVAENVRALLNGKFAQFVQEEILRPLSNDYVVHSFELAASDFGVPQVRSRVFFVGFKRGLRADYQPPAPTHRFGDSPLPPMAELLNGVRLRRCMGAREALGLKDIGIDALAPTLRSGLTGPRHTTSILSSVSALKIWNRLQIWPNGVAANGEAARKFRPENGHFRLSVSDCALLQGFPENWRFSGAVYKAIGQIGNSVAPPMAYHVALSVARALSSAA